MLYPQVIVRRPSFVDVYSLFPHDEHRKTLFLFLDWPWLADS